MDTEKAVKVYTKPLLKIYDYYVLGFSNRFLWQCPKSLILEMYNKYVSNIHLDIGVGTGYFLDKCQFPSSRPTIMLVDLNSNSLQFTAKRIARYQPQICLADIYETLPLENSKFDSLGINYLLHCLPGDMQTKSQIFTNIRPFLNPGAVVFGATILGKDIKASFFASKLMRFYNNNNIFSNLQDSEEDLKSTLTKHLKDVLIIRINCVALFVGEIPVDC
jgi:ubiquinone/menaquinone biosynthesis C-methylase UbiE